METIQRLTLRFFPRTAFTPKAPLLTRPALWPRKPAFRPVITPPRRSHSSGFAPRAGWLLGMRQKKNALPDIVKAGDPVLHEPAQEVRPEEIGSERIQKIIDDMVNVMRKAPGVGLAAPQIGIPFRVSIFPPLILLAPFLFLLGTGDKKNALPDIVKAGDLVLHEPAEEVRPEEIGSDRIQNIIDDMVKVMRKVSGGVGLAAPQIGIPFRIIVLEDTKEYISFASKQETKEQDRRPFDLLVVINPKLEKKGNRTAFFFEGCLSVDGFRAVVERHLEVEVSGFDRDGQAIKVNASGWQARIFQHECDHLDGTIYVDKMVPRTFRTVSNLDLPLAIGCPKVSVR